MMDQAGEQKAVSSPGMYVLLYILLIPTAIYILLIPKQPNNVKWEHMHAGDRRKGVGSLKKKEKTSFIRPTP